MTPQHWPPPATTGIETFNELAAWTTANAEYVNKWIHDSLIKPEDEGLTQA
jgi:predicted flap endonuclease-1-like 5' DNA nuclease